MQKFHFQLTCIAQKRPYLLWLKTIVNAIMIIISYFLATELFFNTSFLQMSLPHSHGILLFLLCLETRRAGKTDASVARRKDEAFGGCAFQVKTAFFYFVQFPYFQWPHFCTLSSSDLPTKMVLFSQCFSKSCFLHEKEEKCQPKYSLCRLFFYKHTV